MSSSMNRSSDSVPIQVDWEDGACGDVQGSRHRGFCVLAICREYSWMPKFLQQPEHLMKLIWGNELGGMGSQRGNATHCLCWDYDIKSVYTFCSVLISLLLLFCSCPTPTSVIFGCILVTCYLSFCSRACIFVMAPHTRQSKRIVTADNSQLTIAENQAWLDSNTQTVSMTTTTTNTNLKGKLQLFLWPDLFDTMGNREEMYHCHQQHYQSQPYPALCWRFLCKKSVL